MPESNPFRRKLAAAAAEDQFPRASLEVETHSPIVSDGNLLHIKAGLSL